MQRIRANPTPPAAPSGAESRLRAQVDEFLAQYLPKAPRHSSPKVLHDGLWGTLRLNPAEVAFIDTPLVQRLRQIHQMGLANFTYPSTTHTRLEHTFGVILQTERLCEALRKNGEGKRIREADVACLRMAALFHDLGHGPFSHTSEEVYGVLPDMVSLMAGQPGKPGRPHEQLTWLIVTSRRFKRFCQKVADAQGGPIPVDEIAGYIVGRPTGVAYKREMVNGPFDADKLDYLFRDSHFSGLPLSVDLDRLWYTARIAKARGRNRLAVAHSGATSLEQVLFAKMILFTSVYHHHKVRACDCMFAGVIEYMREKGISLPVRDRKLSWTSPIDFLWVTDAEFLSFGYETSDNDLHELIHNLFFRRLLKRALIISPKTIEQSPDDLWDELQQHAKEGPGSAQFRRDLARHIWESARKPCLLQQVWVDLPEPPAIRASNETFVLQSEEGGAEPMTLDELFPTSRWAQQYGVHKWRGHVFCPEECRDMIAAAARDVLQERFRVRVKPEAFTWCKMRPPK